MVPDEGDQLYAIAKASADGTTWSDGPIYVCVDSEVYFKAVDSNGNLASTTDWDTDQYGVKNIQDTATYSWTFGDGNSGTGVVDTDSYSTAGQYTVTLTVDDVDGAGKYNDPQKQDTVTVNATKVTDVTAVGATKITQVVGNQNILHFVTPKGIGNVTLTASIDPDTEAVRQQIDWEGATEDPTDPRKATVSKAAAGKNVVKIKIAGMVCKEMRVWVLWSTPGPPTQGALDVDINDSRTRIRISPSNLWKFDRTISPASIITDPDRPNLADVNTNSAPNGTKHHVITDDLLSGGATLKWDESRQFRIKILNPHLYTKAQLPSVPGTLWNNQPVATDVPEGTCLASPSGDWRIS